MTKILIVDQDETIQMLYADELSEAGYDVILCADVGGLMGLIERKNPDLVVMEVVLGDYNGLNLLQEINRSHRNLPVVLCTLHTEFKEDPRALAADAYVVKGFKLKTLKEVIQTLLETGKLLQLPSGPVAGVFYESAGEMPFSWEEDG